MRRLLPALFIVLGTAISSSPAAAQTVSSDFDRDGFADLAIGVPGQDVSGSANAGQVYVAYGDRTGFTDESETQFWNQDSGVTDLENAEPNDRFGDALATGDFNGDGYADLAIGVPGEDLSGIGDPGAVHIIYGSAAGLTETGNQFWHQDSAQGSATIEDSLEVGDQLGWTLAAGNFGKTSADDLAIAVPGEDINTAVDAGAVNVIYGGPTGLSAAGDQLWHQDRREVEDSAETDDRLGEALAVANFGRTSHDDLAIGVWREDLGALTDAGVVNVIYGTSTGLSASGDQVWHQDRGGIADAAENSDRLGFGLAAANFGKSGHADLAVGVPYEALAAGPQAGAVNVVYGRSTGLSARGDQFWHQDRSGVMGKGEISERFGSALGAANFGKSRHADLAVGVPVDKVGTAGPGGAVNILYGNSAGLVVSGNQLWHQDSKAINDVAEDVDRFGSAFAAANFGSTSHADLAVGVYGESVGAVSDAGAVNVIYGTSEGLSAFGDAFLEETFFGGTPEEFDSFGFALPGGRISAR